jgi:hypothetical protein
VHDNILLAILQRGYEMFHFFTGGFDHLRPRDDLELFTYRVSTFFTRYVSSVHLERQDISDLFQAVHFLTLDASSFLQVSTLLFTGCPFTRERFSATYQRPILNSTPTGKLCPPGVNFVPWG